MFSWNEQLKWHAGKSWQGRVEGLIPVKCFERCVMFCRFVCVWYGSRKPVRGPSSDYDEHIRCVMEGHRHLSLNTAIFGQKRRLTDVWAHACPSLSAFWHAIWQHVIWFWSMVFCQNDGVLSKCKWVRGKQKGGVFKNVFKMTTDGRTLTGHEHCIYSAVDHICCT